MAHAKFYCSVVLASFSRIWTREAGAESAQSGTSSIAAVLPAAQQHCCTAPRLPD